MYMNTCRDGTKKMESCSFQCCPGQDQRQWAGTEIHKVPSEHQETLFYFEGDRALEQVAQGTCRVSILGDIQKPSGHGTGLLDLGGPV